MTQMFKRFLNKHKIKGEIAPIPKQSEDKIELINSSRPTPIGMLVDEKLIYNKTKDLPRSIHTYTDKELAEHYNIYVEYVSFNITDKTLAIIKESETHNAHIQVSKELKDEENAFMIEIGLYIMRKDEDGKFRDYQTREKNEKRVKPIKHREYIARAIMIPRYDIEEVLKGYDSSKPKMDEVKLVRDLAKKYKTTERQVIRRIQDIRQINSIGDAYKRYVPDNLEE